MLLEQCSNEEALKLIRTEDQVHALSWQEFRWLLEELSVDQPKAHRPVMNRDLAWKSFPQQASEPRKIMPKNLLFSTEYFSIPKALKVAELLAFSAIFPYN